MSVMLMTNLQVFGQTGEKTIIQYPGKLKEYCPVHKKVNETSGLIFFNNHLWTFNDSGGKPELYRINKKTGKVDQKIVVNNGVNKDWESIAQDEQFIFVGNFGNNLGNRKDLKIYKIPKDKITDKKKIKINAGIIGFSYDDQQSYEVKNRSNNYDCESLIVFESSLIVFTKNWEDGRTRMYKIPKEPGDYKLNPLSSYDVGGLVTGAEYNPSTKELVMIGYKNYVPFVYLFENFDGLTLNSEDIYKIDLVGMKNSQTEGICWLDDEILIISTERTRYFKQAAFMLDIEEAFKLARIEFD